MVGKKEVAKKAKKSSEPTQQEQQSWEILRLKADRETFAQRLRRVGHALITRMKKEWKLERGILDNHDVLDLRGQVLVEAVKALTREKCEEEGFSLESKVASLESCVSQLSSQVARLQKKCRTYEEGLECVLLRDDLAVVKDKILSLQSLAVNSGYVFTCETEDEVRKAAFGPVATLTLPAKSATKLPGTELLSNLDLQVRGFVVNELNREQISGSDWRLLAQQVGINCETIKHWMSMKLQNPAGQVLINWMMVDPGATVKQLYDHLNSPGLRRSELCKILSYYYEIN